MATQAHCHDRNTTRVREKRVHRANLPCLIVNTFADAIADAIDCPLL